jgi:16S rRNA (adenine1518-N6/adenine1519-N6)-dimethyltransferase
MRAKKSLGQNFLQDESVINRIVDSLDLLASDTVIEIGPGRGALTVELVERAGNVIAIEFDRDMIAALRERFSPYRLTLVESDVLEVDLAALVRAGSGAKVVGNLPYNISTPILQKLIACRMSFSTMVLMFQREVVDRITAPPGGRERGLLSVLAENAFHIERLFDVPPAAFSPVPKVWSAIVRLRPKTAVVGDEALLRQTAIVAFAQKRKTLQNNLKQSFDDAPAILADAGIDGSRRAETLTLTEWGRLTSALKTAKASRQR